MVRVPDAKSDCSRRGEAEVRIINFKTTWSEFHLPSQSRSKAVVCISTPRMYPCRGYFLVITKTFSLTLQNLNTYNYCRCWCCILLACSYFEWLHVKHYCPYCDYMIGEYKGRNQIVLNKEALQRSSNITCEE